ncbi:diguanylate cyclase [Campylobacter iguaniorum]|uniref:diguanylate cyclase n=1 Tax=Campylobacter iguaniorum TaxID=1244531 RepID=A0A076F8R7_9BACT|nr:GGDEF domain-containing protein [Campylobacter iguaniorum]AII14630.1 diguanylate cyclase [Campylobacter iguaniorum]ALV24365.1 diguanylate cyclase [Campylobacter iguaniorum]
MASIINEVIKDAIKEANAKHLVLTPDNYYSVFCEVAKKRGIVVEDCQKLEKYMSKLDSPYQLELKKMNVKNVDELFAYISSRLNRLNPADTTKLLQSLVILNKRILQSINVLHNTEAKNLSNVSLQTINRQVSVDSVELMKDKWFNFLSNYDDSYLKKLEPYGIKQSDDIQKIINILLKAKLNPSENLDLKDIAELVVAALVPSIASSMNDELASISSELSKQPELLQSTGMQDDIKRFILKRVDLDKNEFKNKIGTLDEILNDIDSKISHFISISSTSQTGVKTIKQDLHGVNIAGDYTLVKEKLINIANSLDIEISDFLSKMNESDKTIKALQSKVSELEAKLDEAREEIQNDFLTGVGSKKAFNIELNRIESVYQRYGVEYCICFFDIDHFKTVNDTYGHDAGDTILSTVGKILKKYSRDVDFVGRYGGEEFVVILPRTSKQDAILFAQKILKSISGFKFIYKDEEIRITISCGVASRIKHATSKETLQKADEHLYEAKNSGRNCIKYGQ